MSLLRELDDAELVVADEDLGLLFVWYGDAGFQVLDENGNVLDAFSSSTAFSRKLTVREARAVIEAHREDLRGDES
ncbi:MAG TPA: hypothetical protein VGI70_03885 [Polyangiales bacterium]